VILGHKEVESGTVAPRRRGGENLPPLPLADLIEQLRGEVAQETGEA
jgi:threonyl-tRNA synthetase